LNVFELWGMIGNATIEEEIVNEEGEFRSNDHWAVVRTRNYVVSVIWQTFDKAILAVGKKGDELPIVVYELFKYGELEEVKELVSGQVDIGKVINEVKGVLNGNC